MPSGIFIRTEEFNKKVSEKRRQTCLKKYGVECNLNLNIADREAKRKQTCLKKYGVVSPMQLESAKEKRNNTCLRKYGISNPFKDVNRIRQGMKEKYGVENPSQSEYFKDRYKKTCLERYGVENAIQNVNIRNKQKQSYFDKYGVEHPWQNEEVKNKRKQTMIERYGVDNPAKNDAIKKRIKYANLQKQPEIRKKRLRTAYDRLFSSNRLKGLVKPLFPIEEYVGIKNMKYKFQCVKCNHIFEDDLEDGRIPRCYDCFPYLKTYNSTGEDAIELWLKSLHILNIQRGNKSIINPYQLDIYLPDYKLAIEFNGLYWHSEIGGNKDRNYHLTKTNLCKEKGIGLIHIFEDEWIEKQDIVKSIIKNKLGLIENKIYARECIIKEVDKEEAIVFLMNNHLQEPIIAKYNYGLFYKDELIYLISLSKPRFNKNYAYELIRSCGKINATIIGGFNKLINHAIETLNTGSIISYVDKRYFNGKGYKDWNLVGESSPSYFYTKNNYLNRESRLKYQKHKIIEKEEDRNLTEWELMQLKGYDRIWDCGNKVFEFRR